MHLARLEPRKIARREEQCVRRFRMQLRVVGAPRDEHHSHADRDARNDAQARPSKSARANAIVHGLEHSV